MVFAKIKPKFWLMIVDSTTVIIFLKTSLRNFFEWHFLICRLFFLNFACRNSEVSTINGDGFLFSSMSGLGSNLKHYKSIIPFLVSFKVGNDVTFRYHSVLLEMLNEITFGDLVIDSMDEELARFDFSLELVFSVGLVHCDGATFDLVVLGLENLLVDLWIRTFYESKALW